MSTAKWQNIAGSKKCFITHAISKIVWLHCAVIVVNLWLFWFQFASQSSRDLFSFQNWSCPVNVKTQILGHEWCYRYSKLENYIDRNIHNNKSGREKNPDLNMYIHTNHQILEFGHIFEKKLIDSESEWQINYEITTMINKKKTFDISARADSTIRSISFLSCILFPILRFAIFSN